MIRKAVFYLNQQNLMLENNADEVELSNGKLALAILVIGCVTFLPLLVISFVNESYSGLSTSYAIELAVLLILVLLFGKLKKRIRCSYILYGAYGFLVAVTSYNSVAVTPDFVCVTILFFLFQMPIVIIDKSWRVNSLVLIYAAVYLCIAVPRKNPALVTDEILNCLLFAMSGIGLGDTLRYIRLENFELKRQGLLRENTDALTGLHNRKSLFERLGAMMTAGDLHSVTGFLMIDIDHFKWYNDTYGHQAGDECLMQISDCFRRFGESRHIEFYRYGGEEFVGIATECTPEGLLQAGQALNQAVLALRIPHRATEEGFVTVSIGLSTTADMRAADYEQLILSQADVALYMAKTQGRNRAIPYAPGMSMQKTPG